MVPKGHAGCSEGFRRAQVTRPSRREASQAASPPTVGGEEKNRRRGDSPAVGRRLHYGSVPEWLANPVLVLKKNNKWRMCIDYTSLNKACPKDPFALP